MESGVYTVFSLGCEDQVHMEIGGKRLKMKIADIWERALEDSPGNLNVTWHTWEGTGVTEQGMDVMEAELEDEEGIAQGEGSKRRSSSCHFQAK